MNLLVVPQDRGNIETFGFEFLGFKVRRFPAGECHQENTGARELGIVVLGGKCSVESSGASWINVGKRAHVFDGLPYAIYLPIFTDYSVTAESNCDLAFCYCGASKAYPPQLVTPANI
jgi:5-deoxy-glucuronate isomerase